MQTHTQFTDRKTYLRSNLFGEKKLSGGCNCSVMIHWKQFDKSP